MSEPEDGVPEGAGSKRLPYEKPALIWEDALGVRPGLIAACNKHDALDLVCQSGSLES